MSIQLLQMSSEVTKL